MDVEKSLVIENSRRPAANQYIQYRWYTLYLMIISTDHDQSLTAAVAHADAVAASYEDVPFAYDEWQEYAVNPRE